MGVLQRFERRLDGLVEGVFARVFGGAVQPAEVAAALQREGAFNKVVVAADRVLVPNDYVVQVGGSDAQRLGAFDAPLRAELAALVAEHAVEQGWSFVGPVVVRFDQVADLRTGAFRVHSAAVPGAAVPGPVVPGPVVSAAVPRAAVMPSRPVVGGQSVPAAAADVRPDRQPADAISVVVPPDAEPRLLMADREVPLDRQVTRIGRAPDVDLRLLDASVSRRHAEVRRSSTGPFLLVDCGSTNGTTVNGVAVREAVLVDGDQVQVGATTMTFRWSGPPSSLPTEER